MNILPTLTLGSALEVPFQANTRYPDPSIEVFDERFMKYRIFSASVEQLFSGMRWAEGPQWIADGRYLLVSDIPNNRILRWDECTGTVGEFRIPSGYANGNARDRQGRLLTCEHGGRRIVRTEHDGSLTVLADSYQGKRLNSPNDIICQSDGTVWFTDPPFGIAGHWEGDFAESELPHAVYRLKTNGELQQVLSDLAGPNGLAFSPDESILYVVESRAKPNRLIWAYGVDSAGELSHKRLLIDAKGAGAIDGMAIDTDGNLWCGWGSDGRLGADAQSLDGVRVFAPDGSAIAHIHLPERCANVCFGGIKRNRLFMAASHSVYALFTNAQGTV